MVAMTTRTEKDFLGTVKIPSESLYGINSLRASENFGLVGGSVNKRLLCAFGLVKLACLKTNASLGYIPQDIAAAIETACNELSAGTLNPGIELGALQGGAGTSTNMLVNETLTNRALQLLGKPCGSYDIISPHGHLNLHQSTNDTYPTALKVAAIYACDELEQSLSSLTDAFQEKEKQFAEVVKLGRTEFQDAVPMTAGQQFGAYAEAFSKDRWRLYKCRERLRVVNLGGTAIGTGLGADQKYIFMVVEQLKKLTNLPLARAENLIQSTQNCDEFVEVSGILKAHASNLFKVSSDLRFLSSGPEGGIGEVRIPPRQEGSSIMPGKVNPVILEMTSQIAIQAIAHDSAVTAAAMNSHLELNALMPLLADNLLKMIEILIEASERLRKYCIDQIKVDPDKCRQRLDASTAVITAFISKIGYDKASQIVSRAAAEKKTIKELLLEENLCKNEEYEYLTSADAALTLGFRKKNENAKDT
ncbi:Aspartate ammonia-lyase [Limihaloglobus sulfuriphilus]|uniref:Aspartate ammonia-lyase n=2 Tax=Limihaloglobus sulfuriphilus TaxID=1851148 RepID=A0A1Q2MI49_9BACT|nr:Aspartate ammonia-lyase [Limihaloglobus sulfuriphilus]